MNNSVPHKYFLFIAFKKISLVALNSKNQIFFTKEILIDDLSTQENFDSLENFLNQNIIEIEKNLGKYINDIFLILDYHDFISVNLSFKYNFKGSKFNPSNITNSLIDLKNQFKKTNIDYKVIHMMINKFITDGVDYSYLPKDMNCNDLYIEARFICLRDDIIENLRKIFSKYQISLNRTLCFNYLKDFKSFDSESIFIVASKVLSGLNQNEIFTVNKSIKNKGFFEKFLIILIKIVFSCNICCLQFYIITY